MSTWINVKDRLPIENMPVLVSDRQKRVCIRSYIGGSISWSRGKCDVTHWTPLPEPPEEIMSLMEESTKDEDQRTI